MTTQRDANRVLGHSYLLEIESPRPPYQPYKPNGWLLAGEITSQLLTILGLFAGIVLALAGYDPTAPLVVMVMGVLLAGIVYVAEEDR